MTRLPASPTTGNERQPGNGPPWTNSYKRLFTFDDIGFECCVRSLAFTEIIQHLAPSQSNDVDGSFEGELADNLVELVRTSGKLWLM